MNSAQFLLSVYLSGSCSFALGYYLNYVEKGYRRNPFKSFIGCMFWLITFVHSVKAGYIWPFPTYVIRRRRRT